MTQTDAAPDAAPDAAYEAKLRTDFAGQSRDDVLRDYREMLRIRRFEEAAARAYTRGKISGFLHLYIGQEAIAIATHQAMQPGDRVVSTYRTHGFALALGSSPGACAAELFGKATGLVGGVGGSMHFFDRDRGLWGGYAIVGNHIPVAAGHAFASKYLGDGGVTLCFLGDGAVAIGPTHEGWTLAGLWKLPVVYVVENNRYSMGTPLARSIPVEDITLKAPGYNMAGRQIEQVVSADWFATRIREKIESIKLTRSNDFKKVPIDLAGQAIIEAGLKELAAQAIAAGHFEEVVITPEDLTSATVLAAAITAQRLTFRIDAQTVTDAWQFTVNAYANTLPVS